MIQITEAQMATFNARSRSEGNARLASYIEARFPKIFKECTPEERTEVIETYRMKAAAHGFRTDEQIGYFMDLVVMYGPSFPVMPWFRPVMSDTTLTASQKVSAIRETLASIGVSL